MPVDPASLARRLKEMQDAFDDATTDSVPPDGDYQAIIRAFDFFEQKDSPFNAFLKTELEIALDPQYMGRKVEAIHNLTDPEKLGWLKKYMQTLGVDTEAFELAEVVPGSQLLDSLLDVPVELSIKRSDRINPKTGEKYVNIYVNARLGDKVTDLAPSDVPATVPAQAAPVTSADDIPW